MKNLDYIHLKGSSVICDRSSFICDHCKEKLEIVFPINVKKFNKIVKDFIKHHKKCE